MLSYTEECLDSLRAMETRINAGVPTKDISYAKKDVVFYRNSVYFWAFKLRPENRKAAEELVHELEQRYVQEWYWVLNDIERRWFAR